MKMEARISEALHRKNQVQKIQAIIKYNKYSTARAAPNTKLATTKRALTILEQTEANLQKSIVGAPRTLEAEDIAIQSENGEIITTHQATMTDAPNQQIVKYVPLLERAAASASASISSLSSAADDAELITRIQAIRSSLLEFEQYNSCLVEFK